MIVEKKQFNLTQAFETESGEILKEPTVAYEEYGPKDGPVILIGHGGLSNHHAAGKYSSKDELPGWWDGIIGPGKPLDTNHFRIICTNSLGSMFGTTSPTTKNPETEELYGPDFPNITFIDIVKFQKAFLDELDIEELFMMAGPSMGSMQSLQMAALYPDFVNSVVAVATAGRMTPSSMALHRFIINAAKEDPNFNEGRYKPSETRKSLRLIHQVVSLYLTDHRIIEKMCQNAIEEDPNAQQKRSQWIQAFLTQGLKEKVKERDLNCYITLANALNSYSLEKGADNYENGVKKIDCPVLLININTDREFPPHWAKELAETLNSKNPGQARVKILESDWGHLGCVKETEAIGKHISNFISYLDKS